MAGVGLCVAITCCWERGESNAKRELARRDPSAAAIEEQRDHTASTDDSAAEESDGSGSDRPSEAHTPRNSDDVASPTLTIPVEAEEVETYTVMFTSETGEFHELVGARASSAGRGYRVPELEPLQWNRIDGKWVGTITYKRRGAATNGMRVSVRGYDLFRWTPSDAILSDSQPTATFVREDGGDTFHVKFTVSLPEPPSESASASLHAWPGWGDWSGPSFEVGKAGFLAVPRNVTETGKWLVHVPGFEPATGSLFELAKSKPITDPVIVDLKLKPGWGCGFVCYADNNGSSEAWPIRVDGVVVGQTDGDGWFLITGDVVPATVEIGTDTGPAWTRLQPMAYRDSGLLLFGSR